MSGGFGCPRGVESEWVDQWDGRAWGDKGGDGAPSEFRRSAGRDKKDKRKRYKGVGAEGGIPLSNFFSRLLLAQPTQLCLLTPAAPPVRTPATPTPRVP